MSKSHRMRSTGRKPAMDVQGVRSLLERYFGKDQPSVADLASEFEVTEATVRKYLKAAGLSLPRGRAALKPRESMSVKTLMDRMPTEVLLGEGRTELLHRRIASGEPVSKVAAVFGLSRGRVRVIRDASGA